MTHVEEALLDNARNLTVELKDEKVPARTPNTSAPEGFPREGARLVVENDRVAVGLHAFRPSRALHIHNRDAVVVPVDPGELQDVQERRDTHHEARAR